MLGRSISRLLRRALRVFGLVRVAPSRPRSAQNLVLSFTFSDTDLASVTDGSQSNQSTVKWYKANRASNFEFVEVTALRNVSIVPPAETTVGDQWKAAVTPFDGLDEGTVVESNIVTIS